MSASREMPLTPEHVQMLHIDYAAGMVRDLVPFTDDPSLPGTIQNACLESFLINVRLLSEFFQKWGRKDDDFWAPKLLPSWVREPIDSELGQRLRHWWEIASKHVVHFGNPRLATTQDDALIVERSTLEQMRDDVFEVYARFREELSASLPENHPLKRIQIVSTFDLLAHEE